jgi:hypothetical protein
VLLELGQRSFNIHFHRRALEGALLMLGRSPIIFDDGIRAGRRGGAQRPEGHSEQTDYVPVQIKSQGMTPG